MHLQTEMVMSSELWRSEWQTSQHFSFPSFPNQENNEAGRFATPNLPTYVEAGWFIFFKEQAPSFTGFPVSS